MRNTTLRFSSLKVLLALFLLTGSIAASAQLRDATVIKNGKKTEGRIRLDFLNDMAYKIEFIHDGMTNHYTPEEIDGFIIDGKYHYESQTISDTITQMHKILLSETKVGNTQLFLQKILEGDLDLYFFHQRGKKTRYFIRRGNTPLRELKQYVKETKLKRVTTKDFLRVLSEYIHDAPDLVQKFNEMKLKDETLVEILKEYNRRKKNPVEYPLHKMVFKFDIAVEAQSMKGWDPTSDREIKVTDRKYFRYNVDYSWTNRIGADLSFYPIFTTDGFECRVGLYYDQRKFKKTYIPYHTVISDYPDLQDIPWSEGINPYHIFTVVKETNIETSALTMPIGFRLSPITWKMNNFQAFVEGGAVIPLALLEYKYTDRYFLDSKESGNVIFEKNAPKGMNFANAAADEYFKLAELTLKTGISYQIHRFRLDACMNFGAANLYKLGVFTALQYRF